MTPTFEDPRLNSIREKVERYERLNCRPTPAFWGEEDP